MARKTLGKKESVKARVLTAKKSAFCCLHMKSSMLEVVKPMKKKKRHKCIVCSLLLGIVTAGLVLIDIFAFFSFHLLVFLHQLEIHYFHCFFLFCSGRKNEE